MKRALVCRSDNKPDLEYALKWLFYDTHEYSQYYGHELLIVVPTLKAETYLCVFGPITIGQAPITDHIIWPGRPDRYSVRTRMASAQETHLKRVKWAITEYGPLNWNGQWEVNTYNVNEKMLPMGERETIPQFLSKRQQRSRILNEL